MATETTLPRNRAPVFLRVLDIQVYRICEDLTQGLIFFMVVFSPWAFGTTQAWSIAVMNGCGYGLGALLCVKLWFRWWRDYQPSRWNGHKSAEGLADTSQSRSDAGTKERRARRDGSTVRGSPTATRLTIVLGILSASIVLFCFVSALNARAAFVPGNPVPIYYQRPEWMTRWLPSSMDANASWKAFWNYLAITISFWAIRDWLLGKSESEIRSERLVPGTAARSSEEHFSARTDEVGDETTLARHNPKAEWSARGFLLPSRVRRLLWTLSICGGFLALESIIQRAAGSSKLLFLVQPHVNPMGETQFGPYAYRANASQYLNLIWPVTLAFWWTLQRAGGRGIDHLLLVACAFMVAGPIISTSRAGAIISVLLFVLSIAVLFGWSFVFRDERERRNNSVGKLILVCGVAALALGLAFGWKSLGPRLGQIGGSFGDREGMYDIARPMARDYPVFGTGPGTYATVFQLYRLTADTYWPAQLHNDWLETRITFGWVGMGLIGSAFAIVLFRWFVPGGIHGGRRFMMLLWLSMAGCLLHARFDFPFQIYSILFVFVVLCALAFTLSRR